jgi:alkyl hydroperoxide reductase subunit AhpF
MKWLEIIELRSVGKNRTEMELQLKNLIDEVKQKTRQQAIKVYSHITVETDFSIHLHNDSKRADISGSPLGHRLVSALKEFGLVNHSVWIEKH